LRPDGVPRSDATHVPEAPDEVAAILKANDGKRVRVTFVDGVTQSVDISSVDDEGVHQRT
jgi:hypothetical protein